MPAQAHIAIELLPCGVYRVRTPLATFYTEYRSIAEMHVMRAEGQPTPDITSLETFLASYTANCDKALGIQPN